MELAAQASNLLARLGIDGFDAPERLPWLVLLALACAFAAGRGSAGALAWPAVSEARAAGGRAFDPVRSSALTLRGLALVALAVALAEPVALHRAPPESGHGLDLILVVDASASMRALDTAAGGRVRSRLDLARDVVSRFAGVRIARGDRVGLVVFGDRAFTPCPLTADGARLQRALAGVHIGVAGEATALGDALALAVKRVRGSATGSPTGRAVVLLTDGRSNSGEIPLDVAAALAAAATVPVHSVGIGRGGEAVAMAGRPGVAGAGLRFERHAPDFGALQRLAAVTGGRSFRAIRPADLEPVFAEIDASLRAPRSLPARTRRLPRREPLLATAGGLLLVEIALARVFRRRLP